MSNNRKAVIDRLAELAEKHSVLQAVFSSFFASERDAFLSYGVYF